MRVKGTSSKCAHRVPTLFWHAWACYVDMWHWSDGCGIDRATAVIGSRHSSSAISGWQWQLTLYTETDRREKRPRLGITHTHKPPYYQSWFSTKKGIVLTHNGHGTSHTPVALQYRIKIKQPRLTGKYASTYIFTPNYQNVPVRMTWA